MNVALLNSRIQIQKNEVITDEIGNHSSSWKDYYSCNATISSESGNEVHVAGETLESVGIAFTIRYSSETAAIIPTSHRVIFKEERFNIIGVDHMNYKKKSIKLLCQKERR